MTLGTHIKIVKAELFETRVKGWLDQIRAVLPNVISDHHGEYLLYTHEFQSFDVW